MEHRLAFSGLIVSQTILLECYVVNTMYDLMNFDISNCIKSCTGARPHDKFDVTLET